MTQITDKNVCCGDCVNFHNECVDGDGYCSANDKMKMCDMVCCKYAPRPTVAEAAKILHDFQKWWRGANTPVQEQKIVCYALDVAIRELRAINNKSNK